MKELVLTSLSFDGQRNDFEQSVFLGYWCLDNNVVFERYKKQTLKSPYKNWDAVLDAANYVQELTKRIIIRIYPIFNDYLNLDLSLKFWEIYLSPSLLNFLGIFYDRYLNIEKVESLDDDYTIKIIKTPDDFRIIDKDIFYYNFFNSSGNLFLYSLILTELNSKKINLEFFQNIDMNHLYTSAGISLKVDSEIAVTQTYKEFILEKLFFNKYVNIGTVYGLSKFEKLYLQFKTLGPYTLCKEIISNVKNRKDRKKVFTFIPKNFLSFPITNSFEAIVSKYLHSFLPVPTKGTIESMKKNTPKLWIGTDIYNNKEIEIGLVKEQRGKWINFQHGGGYGALKSLPQTYVEYCLATKFVSWGWRFNHIQVKSNIVNFPESPMLSKVRNLRNRKHKDGILLISTDHPRAFYKLQSQLLTDQHECYEEGKSIFYNALSNQIRSKFVYRPYPVKYCSIVEPIVRQNVKIDNTKYKNQTDLYCKYRIIVVDHISTSHLISIAMDIPTIILYDPDIFGLCNEAQPYYYALQKAGIVFNSPMDAAEMLNREFDNINDWWHNSERQKALNEFRKVQCDSSNQWKYNWVKFVRDELADIESAV